MHGKWIPKFTNFINNSYEEDLNDIRTILTFLHLKRLVSRVAKLDEYIGRQDDRKSVRLKFCTSVAWYLFEMCAAFLAGALIYAVFFMFGIDPGVPP